MKSKNIDKLSSMSVMNQDYVVYGTYDNPLFVAEDIRIILGYDTVVKMIDGINSSETMVARVIRGGLNLSVRVRLLTENGLYEVLMRSTKPIARMFKEEVKKLLTAGRKGVANVDVNEHVTKLTAHLVTVTNLLVESKETIKVLEHKVEEQAKIIEQAKQKELIISENPLAIRSLIKNGINEWAKRDGLRISTIYTMLEDEFDRIHGVDSKNKGKGMRIGYIFDELLMGVAFYAVYYKMNKEATKNKKKLRPINLDDII